jgi:hypothetical protein
MSDLIEKFFQADLTEAEENLLSERLLGQEGDADRFAVMAEAKYRSYGLPEPVLGGGQGNGFLKQGAKALLLLLGGAALLGAACWVLCRSMDCPAEPVYKSPSVEEALVPRTEEAPSAPSRKVAKKTLAAPIPDRDSPATGKGLQIQFTMAEAGRASVRVLGKDEREVRRLFEGPMAAGSWSVTWDGLLADGQPAASGIYHVEVTTNGATKTREVRLR